jgi:hypothetical protein
MVRDMVRDMVGQGSNMLWTLHDGRHEECIRFMKSAGVSHCPRHRSSHGMF